MPFADLKTTSLSSYLSEQRSDDPLWFFLHIPKTAGSSFSAEIAENAGPYKRIWFDYDNQVTTFHNQIEAAVDSFVKYAADNPVKSSSGHVRYRQLKPIKDVFPDLKLVTFLRNPVARYISDYFYQRTPVHPAHESFTAEFGSIEEYIDFEPSHNKMARFLTDDPASLDPDAIIRRLDTEFAFVGLQEMYPMCFNCMLRMMGGMDALPKEHLRKTSTAPSWNDEQLSRIRQKIAANNATDMAIYEHVRGILSKRREEWVEIRNQENEAGISG